MKLAIEIPVPNFGGRGGGVSNFESSHSLSTTIKDLQYVLKARRQTYTSVPGFEMAEQHSKRRTHGKLSSVQLQGDS